MNPSEEANFKHEQEFEEVKAAAAGVDAGGGVELGKMKRVSKIRKRLRGGRAGWVFRYGVVPLARIVIAREGFSAASDFRPLLAKVSQDPRIQAVLAQAVRWIKRRAGEDFDDSVFVLLEDALREDEDETAWEEAAD